MPKKLHDKLAKQARKKGYTGKRLGAYVYGTMENIKQGKKSKRGGRRRGNR